MLEQVNPRLYRGRIFILFSSWGFFLFFFLFTLFLSLFSFWGIIMSKPIANSTIRAVIRRLDAYLVSKGVPSVNSLRKVDKIRLYCQLENKGNPPSRKETANFLFNEFKNPNSKISALIKLPSKKVVKKQRAKAILDRKTKYNDYINSNEWRSFRLSIIKQRGRKCEKCGATDRVIHAHHLTYERFTCELPEDIQLLCVICHNNHHKRESRAKSKKAKKQKKMHDRKNLNVKGINITSRDAALQRRYDKLKQEGKII